MMRLFYLSVAAVAELDQCAYLRQATVADLCWPSGSFSDFRHVESSKAHVCNCAIATTAVMTVPGKIGAAVIKFKSDKQHTTDS